MVILGRENNMKKCMCYLSMIYKEKNDLNFYMEIQKSVL